jgi:ketosteroid isomerase-like protein
MSDAEVRDLLDRFNAAWGAHDLDETLALCTDDVVFESTGPAPDGERHEGKDAVRVAWKPIFDDERANFEAEDAFSAGDDRYVQLWRYDWANGHVRGVDVFRVRGSKVAEKFSYVKG